MFFRILGTTINLDEVAAYEKKYSWPISGNVGITGIVTLKSGKEQTISAYYWSNPEEFLQLKHFDSLLEYYSLHNNIRDFDWGFDLNKVKEHIAQAKNGWESYLD